MHDEHHRIHRAGWLRAAVLGANDGVISTGSLVVGVASADSGHGTVLLTGVAAIVAGAMAMAAGEYVSVSSQRDIEEADLAKERSALSTDTGAERAELADIYVRRGLTPALASEVAGQLMAHDALSAHLRDELGISEIAKAQPVVAALASAACFTAGGVVPLLATLLAPPGRLALTVAAVCLAVLGVLGALAARAGGANLVKGAVRVLVLGGLAMATTSIVGALFKVNL